MIDLTPITSGLTGTAQLLVGPEHTASFVESGRIAVLATPVMINVIKKLPTDGEKGAVFERLTQIYLQTTPEYQTELRHVWTLREVPPAVRRRLDLPSLDEGSELIACTRQGQYWAIQSNMPDRSELGPKGDVTATKGSDYFCSFEKDGKYRGAQLDAGDAQAAFRGGRFRQ
jgi:hypothetical protein